MGKAFEWLTKGTVAVNLNTFLQRLNRTVTARTLLITESTKPNEPRRRPTREVDLFWFRSAPNLNHETAEASNNFSQIRSNLYQIGCFHWDKDEKYWYKLVQLWFNYFVALKQTGFACIVCHDVVLTKAWLSRSRLRHALIVALCDVARTTWLAYRRQQKQGNIFENVLCKSNTYIWPLYLFNNCEDQLHSDTSPNGECLCLLQQWVYYSLNIIVL